MPSNRTLLFSAPAAACLALMLLQPMTTMAQTDPDPLADDQRRKAVAEAKAQALEAEKRALDAQVALDAVRKQQAAAANPSAQDKALVDARVAKDLADARKAAIDSQLAADKARLGGVTDSGITGKVDLAESAGKLEALLFGHAALRTAADDIVKQVAIKKGNGKQVFVYTAGQLPNLQAVANFAVQLKAVSDALTQASNTTQQALDAAAAKPESEAALATVGVALESVTKLLSFFRSDFSVQGRDITLEDMALVQAVGGKLSGLVVRVPSLFNPAVVEGTASLVTAQVTPVAEQQRLARDKAENLAVLIARKQKLIDDEATHVAQKRALESEVARLRSIADGLRNASTAYEAILGRLMAPDEATSAMLRDSVVWNQLKNPGSLLLVLKVQASGGSSYTVKNLWTSFGAMPYYVASGTVVSYALFQGSDGTLLASDVLPVHGGFHGVKSAKSSLEGTP